MFKITKNHWTRVIWITVIFAFLFLSYTEEQVHNSALESLELVDPILELVADSDGTYTIINDGDTTRYRALYKNQLY